ncbi:MAG TPA: TonB-dependent receptor plug domain-containing protein [Gemmatimonadaceae bacterium]|nr:TonB-dependent receptor plug domain-containing protein [Gemmatimonadaceae bacterium]
MNVSPSPRLRLAVGLLVIALASEACASAGGRSTDTAERSASEGGQRLEDMFAGKFPGVDVYRVPTGGIKIRIRGASTVLGDTEPLYVIDGAKVQSGTGGLLFIDPGDILKIVVLKDIGSTAAYGSEGANGVILITTKNSR